MRLGLFFIWALMASLLISCGTSRTYENQDTQARYESEEESGIGGTGMRAEGSGLGGTGIIGEVTGFGSIFVNGEEVEVDAHAKLFLDGETIVDYEFARGDVVAIRAEERGRQSIANEIYIRHEVIGPVQKVMSDIRGVIVLGQRVNIRSQALPKPGQSVRVSGFRDARGIIHASRISTTSAGQVLLVGKVQRNANGWHIRGQQLRLPAGARLHEGQTLRVRGSLQHDTLQVMRLNVITKLPFQQPISRLLLQGYVWRIGSARYYIAGQTITVTQQALQQQLSQQTAQPLRLELRVTPDHWHLKRMLVPRRLPKGQPKPINNDKSGWQQQPNGTMTSPMSPHSGSGSMSDYTMPGQTQTQTMPGRTKRGRSMSGGSMR